MSASPDDRVSLALRDPTALLRYGLPQWEALIGQARSANLLARLATLLDEGALLDTVPPAPRAHLRSSLVLAEAQRDSALREIDYVRKALAKMEIDVVLLKGAAYLAAGLPVARGRVFTDIDILVPRDRLPQVEAALMLHGWATTHHDPYDQRYYREWMHELPPMQHVKRGTVVDVHHAILPTTARLRPDSAKLLAAAVPVPGESRLRVLSPADMVLHSATHLFHNEELDQGMRDLADLDSLLRDFAREPSFWTTLTARAEELDLGRPLHYALRFATRILATPVPREVLGRADRGAPIPPLRPLMDAMFERALRPVHPAAADALTPAARKLLYFRAHWLRMRPLRLLHHLVHKAWMRRKGGFVQAA